MLNQYNNKLAMEQKSCECRGITCFSRVYNVVQCVIHFYFMAIHYLFYDNFADEINERGKQ